MKTYNVIILAFLTAFCLTQCTPKTTEAVTNAAEQVGDATTEMSKTVDPALAWRGTAPAPAPARKIQLGNYSTFTLDNGLEVIVVENNKLPRVAYSLSLKNNPVLEGEQAGYVSVMGDLLSRGTKTKTKAQIDEAVDFIGGRLSTSSSGMFVSSLTKHKASLLDLAQDVLFNPSFNAEEFDKIITQARSGLQTVKTDPNSMASNVASVLNYGTNHPYGEVDSEEALDKIEIESCKAYYDAYFKPNNAYLTIVGDITKDEAMQDAEKYFGAWEKGMLKENNYELPVGPNESKVAFVNKEAAVQSVINITYPIDLHPADDDVLAAGLMNSILGGGIFSGRLMQNLREDKAFTYGARSRLSSDPLVGEFVAFASVRNEVSDSSVTEFIYEMNRLASEPVSEEDLQLAKNSQAGSFARSLEQPQTLARYALNIVRYDLPKDYYETYLERLEAVTVADISAAAKKYIRPNNANIVVVGNKDEVAKSLLPFDADGEIDYYDPFGKKIEISDVVPTDITAEEILANFLKSSLPGMKHEEIKTMQSTYGMNIMGQDASMQMSVVVGEKVSNVMTMGGNVMQDSRYDGKTVKMSGMQGTQTFTEGPEFDQLKGQTKILEQYYYTKDGYSMELKGIEQIGGQQVYKVALVSSEEKKTTEFYNVETGLLTRSVSVDDSGKTILSTFSEYKDIGGLIWPHKITIEGAAPFALNMELKDIKLNADLSDDLFSID